MIKQMWSSNSFHSPLVSFLLLWTVEHGDDSLQSERETLGGKKYLSQKTIWAVKGSTELLKLLVKFQRGRESSLRCNELCFTGNCTEKMTNCRGVGLNISISLSKTRKETISLDQHNLWHKSRKYRVVQISQWRLILIHKFNGNVSGFWISF